MVPIPLFERTRFFFYAVLTGVLVPGVCASIETPSVCSSRFASLTSALDSLYPTHLIEHRDALLQIAAKHLEEISKPLPDQEFNKLLHAILNPTQPKFAKAAGQASVENGTPLLMLTDQTRQSFYGLVAVVHESQHLVDMMAPSRPFVASLARGTSQLRLETRAFTRQWNFLSDVINEIGIEGVMDLVARHLNLSPADRSKMAVAIKNLMLISRYQTSDAELLKNLGPFDRISSQEALAIIRDAGAVEGTLAYDVVSPLGIFGNQRGYVHFYLQLEQYRSNFANEKKVLELQLKLAQTQKVQAKTIQRLEFVGQKLRQLSAIGAVVAAGLAAEALIRYFQQVPNSPASSGK